MSHIQQLAVVTASLPIVAGLMIFGTLTKNRRTKHLMFWVVFVLILGGSLIYSAAFR
jgi:hypothetical protein